MISREYCRTMAAYNQWMNQRLYQACETLPASELTRDRGAFFGSIQATLNHLLWGDSVWLARFTGQPSPGPMGTVMAEDFRDLRRLRVAKDRDILAWADSVSEAWLRGEFRWISGLDGLERARPGWVLATHVFNHQTHHRGQVTTLLKQAGIDPGVTDLPWMPGLAE